MPERIEIPEVVPAARRRRGAPSGHHGRRSRARRADRPRVLVGGGEGGARRADRTRSQGGRRRAARPGRGVQPATCATPTSTKRWPTASWPSGEASTPGSATPASHPWSTGPLAIVPEVWRDVIDVNLTGAFLGARAAARVMERRRPHHLHRFGARRAAPEGAHRLQRLQGRARRDGEGPGARPRPGRHHRQRRVARLVRVTARRRIRQQRTAGGVDPLPHGAAAMGSVR